MSSFVCDRKHYTTVAHNLKKLLKNDKFYLEYDLRNKFPMLEDSTLNENKIDRLVKTIELINVESFMRQYYGDSEAIEAQIKQQIFLLEAKPKPIDLTNLGLFKALQCINYQIEIEHIKRVRLLSDAENDALFFLDRIIDNVATFICKSLPSYDSEAWSIA